MTPCFVTPLPLPPRCAAAPPQAAWRRSRKGPSPWPPSTKPTRWAKEVWGPSLLVLLSAVLVDAVFCSEYAHRGPLAMTALTGGSLRRGFLSSHQKHRRHPWPGGQGGMGPGSVGAAEPRGRCLPGGALRGARLCRRLGAQVKTKTKERKKKKNNNNNKNKNARAGVDQQRCFPRSLAQLSCKAAPLGHHRPARLFACLYCPNLE